MEDADSPDSTEFRDSTDSEDSVESRPRILILSPFFYPEPISTGKANRRLAEALLERSGSVTVVCSHPLYPSWRPRRSCAAIDGVRILRGGAWVRYPGAMPLRRMVLELWFAGYSAARAWRLRKETDIAVSILPPSLFVLFLHSLLPRRVRRVAVVHDLQGVLAAQKQSFLRRVIVRAIHAVESRVFRSQDLCVFFSADMARAARASYRLDAGRVAVQYPFLTLPHRCGGDLGRERKPVRKPDRGADSERLTAIFPPGPPHVVYSGALGYKQNSRELIAFLQAAAERFPDARFHVLSGGPLFEDLRRRYERSYKRREERSSTPRVRFHPLVDEQDLEELYARSDIQIVPQAEGTEDGALPSKLPNLLAAGVYPLAICAEDSEVARLIRRAGTGSVSLWDREIFLARLGSALEAVRREPASARRARVAPLLDLFSVGNMVRLILGREMGQEAEGAEIDPRPSSPGQVRELSVHARSARETG